jgi:hypothetical protein
MNGSIIGVLIVAAMFGLAGYRVGTRRGRPVLGAVLGFALGLIGLGAGRDDRRLRGRVRHIRALPGRPGRLRDRPRRLSDSSAGSTASLSHE